ncbi:MAG TPA: aldehyde dehydrogenase family protein, partial [Mycobacterium sp.]|nr:aldehyde dehydrogenase family protein [Mycobacterium sp.]
MNNDKSCKNFIGGQWVESASRRTFDNINPADTSDRIGTFQRSNAEDVAEAVVAAKAAFPAWKRTPPPKRAEILFRAGQLLYERKEALARDMTREMGKPLEETRGDVQEAIDMTFYMAGEGRRLFGQTTTSELSSKFCMSVRTPIGVCGLITPWNWPLNQIAAKVAPALAAGCTMVLKPSELAPLNALVFTEILDAAGVPAGVFNLVNGDGPTVGVALSKHPDIDMVSFTGSTRAGIEVARNAAPTVKRVAQELGGKSANIILDDADLDTALTRDVCGMYENSGQSCNAASRILVPESRLPEAVQIAREAADGMVVGAPEDPSTAVGPLVSQAQFEKVQRLIQSAVDEGAELVTGGLGRPEGIERGYFVKPTVLANVTNDMTIAREEIFGPVLTLIAYKDEEDAVRIANSSSYGLGGRVSSGDRERARRVARRVRTGMVHINGAPLTADAPFG